MSSCSLSISYSDQADAKVKSLTIFYTELAERVNSLVFIPKIQRHVEGILSDLPPLCEQIEQEVRIYSPGNSEQKDAIIARIDIILTNVIHENRFPDTFKRIQLQTLAGALSPIKVECERLREGFFNEERRQKDCKENFEKQKNQKLCELLRNEQEHLSSHINVLSFFLDLLKTKTVGKNPVPKVYFAYAWPTDERQKEESWVQTFLTKLHEQLLKAGIHSAQLDIVSNRYGNNIYQYMEQTETYDYVLLFGTESLKNKHGNGFSAVCTELIHILRKRRKDEEQALKRIFPILLSGTIDKALPPEYER